MLEPFRVISHNLIGSKDSGECGKMDFKKTVLQVQLKTHSDTLGQCKRLYLTLRPHFMSAFFDLRFFPVHET